MKPTPFYRHDWPPCQEAYSHGRRGSCREGRAQQLGAAIREPLDKPSEEARDWLRKERREEGWGCLFPQYELNCSNAASEASYPSYRGHRKRNKTNSPNCVHGAEVARWELWRGLKPLFKHWKWGNTSYLFKNKHLILEKAVCFVRNFLVKSPMVSSDELFPEIWLFPV